MSELKVSMTVEVSDDAGTKVSRTAHVCSIADGAGYALHEWAVPALASSEPIDLGPLSAWRAAVFVAQAELTLEVGAGGNEIILEPGMPTIVTFGASGEAALAVSNAADEVVACKAYAIGA